MLTKLWSFIKRVGSGINKLSFGSDIVVAFLLIFCITSVSTLLHERAAREAAEVRAAQVITINDSTQARYALLEEENSQLKALNDAAKKVGGKLVAGAEVKTKPDTIHDTIPAAPTLVSIVDSSRSAVLDTTAKGYHIHIAAFAPKFPAHLSLSYNIETPAFDPEVGFVSTPDGYMAVVSWAGQEYTTEHAFFVPPKAKPLSLRIGASLFGTSKDNVSAVSWQAFLALQEQMKPNLYVQLRAGVEPGYFVGVEMERVIW